MPKQDLPQSAQKKKNFKMPDIYIILGIFILLMAVLTYIVPSGQYDRHVVETVHGVQNLVVANTYHAVEPHPAGWLEIITAIPYGFERAAGIVVLTFMVGACMGLIKRAGLIDLGVQRLSRAVGQSEFLVAPVLMLVLSLLAAFIGVPELSLAYLPVFLPLFYRLGYDGMTATAVALLSPCMGFTFGITIPGSVGMGQQIAQVTMFSCSGLRAVVLAVVILISIVYVMVYAARVKKDPQKSLTYDTDIEVKEKLAAEEGEKSGNRELVFTSRQTWAGISCLVMFPFAVYLILSMNLGFEAIGGLFLTIGIIAAIIAGKTAQEICDDINAGMRDLMVGALLCGVASAIAVVMDKGVNYRHDCLLARAAFGHNAAGAFCNRYFLGTGHLQRLDSRRHGTHDSDDANPFAAWLSAGCFSASHCFGECLGRAAYRHLLSHFGLFCCVSCDR